MAEITPIVDRPLPNRGWWYWSRGTNELERLFTEAVRGNEAKRVELVNAAHLLNDLDHQGALKIIPERRMLSRDNHIFEIA